MEGLSRTRWRQIETILDEVLDLETTERAAHLDEVCQGDPDLRAEVEAFLAADNHGHPLLDTGLEELTGSWFGEMPEPGTPPVELAALDPGTRLGSYEILSRVGAGGMGEVYRAKDLELGREVAVKVLRDDAAADAERLRRFEREARAASALNHPNIVTIHGVGEERGTRYIVMEHVEGRTLRELLAAGPIPGRELFRLASQIASGLEKAHAAGIVHRDLKPENVMVSTDGFAKILDFGLTKLMWPLPEDRYEAPSTEVDETRPFLGTMGYMSPEQVQGEPLDFRSDQFSLGSILYEMATGRPAFRRGSVGETLVAILDKEPEPPLDSGLPARFRALVERCLSKAPGERFDSTGDLVRELASLRAPFARATERPSKPPAASIDSLAVLPLVNLGGDPGEEYFADGMTEALIADLARLGALRVISRTSVMPLKGTDEPLPEIARQLGVEGIVEGSVLRAGNRVRITAQLLHGPTDSHLWAESYERELGDVLALQGEVARAIAKEIQLRLDPDEQARLERRPSIPPEAHECYLLGRYLLNQRTTAALKKSVEHFERAIDLAPDYAPAYSGLADSFALLAGAGHGASAGELVEKAREAAIRALELDEGLAAAHTSLGFLRFKFDRDWSGAETAFRRALELGPNDASAHHWYALFLSVLGRHEEAEAHILEARKLDPLSLIIRVAASRVLQLARKPDRAIEHCREVLELDPGYAEAHFNLGMCWLQKSRYREAIEELEKAIAESGERPQFLAMLGNALARSGRAGAARRILDRLGELGREEPVSPTAFAMVHLGLGEHDRALDFIEEAVERRDGMIVFSNVESMADGIRTHPRFADCLRRLGLTQ